MKHVKFFLLLVATSLLLCGCSTPSGIPNFSKVSEKVYRGGQPDDAGWRTLKDLGVVTVIKLNSGRDEWAEKAGMRVINMPISTWQQTLGKPSVYLVTNAIYEINWELRQNHAVYVHCTHGQDRTGLVIGAWRVNQGWNKAAAYAEMRQLKFHPTLFGLQSYWQNEVNDQYGSSR